MSQFSKTLKRVSLLICIIYPLHGMGVSSEPIKININNPKFRKLIVAIPSFTINTPEPSKNISWAKSLGSERIQKLLEFSGIFRPVEGSVYLDLLKSPISSDTKDEDIDFKSWRALNIEAVVQGKVIVNSDRLTIEVFTIDIAAGKKILGKRFNIANSQAKFTEAMNTYADRILEHYSGRSGMFNSKIVFIGRKTRKSSKQVYMCNFDGTGLVQITNGTTPHVSPSWSPDGTKIVFTSYEDGNPDLFVYDLKTGRKRKLAGGKGLNSGGHWAPNGKILAYTGSYAGDTDVFTVSSQGNQRRLLIRGQGLDVDPVFSPDNKWLVYVSGRYGNPHIFRATLDWKSETKVVVTGDKRLTYAGWYNATPDWSPSSDRIAFGGYDKDTNRFDVFVMNPDGTKLERLTIRSGDNESPSWSPNGIMMAFQSNRIGKRDVKGPAHLYMMRADGSEQRKIDIGLYEAQTPDWGPNLK